MHKYLSHVNKRKSESMQHEPWELVPELKKEHLESLANLLVLVRGEVIDRHEPELGDTRLSLGIRAYECCRTRIILNYGTTDFLWLSIINSTGRFTFAINGVPVRFSRNAPNALPDRKLIRSAEAEIQMELFAQEGPSYTEVHWFLVIDSPYDTPVENAYFVGYDESNTIVCKWEIPVSDHVLALGDVNEDKPEAVAVEPAAAKLKTVKKKKNVDEND